MYVVHAGQRGEPGRGGRQGAMLNTEYSAELAQRKAFATASTELAAFAEGASFPLSSSWRAPGTAQAVPRWFRLSSA